MSLSLAPVKKLILSSFVLHIISLCALIAVYILQVPLLSLTGNFFIREIEEVLPISFPSIFTALTIIFFILHGALMGWFLKGIVSQNEHQERLRTFNIVSFIYLGVFFVLSWGTLETFFVASEITDSREFLAWNQLRATFITLALAIRTVAISLFLGAAFMSWYYCFTRRSH